MSEAFEEDTLINFLHFRKENQLADPKKLLIKYGADPLRKPWAEALQVESRLHSKLPSEWFDKGFQCTRSKWAEQCSSLATARYKANWLKAQSKLYDLTGGLGIDSIAFAQRGLEVHYTELDAELAALSTTNFQCLHLPIEVHQGDGLQSLPDVFPPNTYIYLDPDRRPDAATAQRSRSLDAMSPTWDAIYQKMALGGHWLVKLSPLHDLQEIIRRMGKACSLHLLEHLGECKEVVMEWHEDMSQPIVQVHEVDEKWKPIRWDAEAIGKQPSTFAKQPKRYLYDPAAAVNKSMAWEAIALGFQLEKIAPNTHLYTSDHFVKEFPGRVFQVTESLHKKNLPTAASIISKNFGSTAEALRKSWKMKEDEERFVICFRDRTHKSWQLLTKRLR